MSLLLLLGDGNTNETDMASVLVLLETLPDQFADVSADLRDGSITRGKQRELDRFQAGRATIRLKNNDRRYDPQHATGPHVGYLKPNRRLIIAATFLGTTYVLFTGYVDRITQKATGPKSGDAVFEASDGFKVLAKAKLASSGYAQEVTNDGPAHWWRLGEPLGSTTLFDSVGDAHLDVVGSPTLAAAGLISREANTAVKLVDQGAFNESRDGAVGPKVVSAPPFTIEAVFRVTTGVLAPGGSLFSQEAGGQNPVGGRSCFRLTVDPIFDRVSLTGGGDADATVASARNNAVSVLDGEIHHVAATWAADGTVLVYVDGVEATTYSGTFTADATFAGGLTHIGYYQNVPSKGFEGTVDEVAIYDYVLTPARVAAHAAAVATPWNGDSPGERAARVLDAISWPAALRALDDGESTLQSATLDMAALEHLQKTAESEFGLVYMTGDGKVRLESRLNLINQPSVATLTDAAGANPAVVFSESEITDDLIRNPVTVSRSEGVAQTAIDQAAIDENQGPSDYTLDGLYHDSDELSLAAAQFLVSEYKDALQRVSRVTITPRGNPTVLFPAVLGLELSDLVTLAETLYGAGTEVTQDSVVEGITHTFAPVWWETRLNVSPAYTGCFLELDTGECGLDDARIYF